MNILACLTPKSDVDYVTDEATLFKVLQTMEHRNFSAIPIIDKKGRYIGTITSGDILGCICWIRRNPGQSCKSEFCTGRG